MKTSTLQSMIALNAKQVVMYETFARMCIDAAKRYKEDDAQAFAADEYKAADKAADKMRTKLAKAVAHQHELIAELASNVAIARIEAKKERLFGAKAAEVLVLSVEVEDALDEMITLKFPAKKDTRPADHPSFAKAK